MTRVRYSDLARLHESIRPELDAAFDEVLRSSAFVGANTSVEFEKALAALTGRRGAVGVGSGTDALALALRAAGIGRGTNVIVPANTFIATAEAVVHAGAEPVFADVDAETLLLTPATVDEVRNDRTGAVIPVHLYGHVVPLTYLDQWAKSGLAVVEDAAQAHLATWRGIPAGSKGLAACFSFFPGKNLGALGDAGAVTSDDEELLAELRKLRDHGRSTKHVHEAVGWCSRLDGLQAAVLTVKLGHVHSWTAARVNIAHRYLQTLSDVDGVRVVPWEDGAVHHCVVVRVADRDRVAETMTRKGIETGIHYRYALTEQPAMAKWARRAPEAERAAREVLSLPIDPLMDDEEIAFVCDALRDAL